MSEQNIEFEKTEEKVLEKPVIKDYYTNSEIMSFLGLDKEKYKEDFIRDPNFRNDFNLILKSKYEEIDKFSSSLEYYKNENGVQESFITRTVRCLKLLKKISSPLTPRSELVELFAEVDKLMSYIDNLLANAETYEPIYASEIRLYRSEQKINMQYIESLEKQNEFFFDKLKATGDQLEETQKQLSETQSKLDSCESKLKLMEHFATQIKKVNEEVE